jgi:DHA3 family macrolide efflux protein-like MFS transporter
VSQTISSLGDGLYLIAFVWLSLELSDGEGLALGGIFSVYTVGEVISGFVSGPIVDRVNRKRILIAVDLARGFIVAVIYVLLHFGIMTLLYLYLCTFLFSILSPLFHRTEFAVLPQIVDKSNLMKANGLLFGLKRLMRVISPIIGGLLVQLTGMRICFFCDTISFFLSSACISLIAIRDASWNINRMKRKDLFHDLMDGCRIVLNSSFLRTIAVYAACINFIGAPIFPLLPIISGRISDNASGYGVLMSALSMGLITAGFLAAIFCKTLRRIRIMLCGLTLCSTAIIALAYSSTFYMLYIFSFFLGAGLNLTNMPIHALLQEQLPSDRIGVVSGFVFTTAQIAMPISMAMSGFMVRFFLVKTIFISLGVLMLTGAILGFFLPQFRYNKDTPKPPTAE